jgi:hypothetical protein
MDFVQELYEKRDAAAVEANEQYRPPRTPTIRASEVAACPRQIYHRLVGDRPSPGDARGEDYGLGGDAAHDVVRRLLNEWGYTVGAVDEGADGMRETLSGRKTFEFEDGTQVAFTARIDGTIEVPEGTALLEIKSIGSYDYRQMRSAFTRGGQEGLFKWIAKNRTKFIWQCEVGMRVHGFSRAYLMIYDRESCNLGVHSESDPSTRVGGVHVLSDDERWSEIMARSARIIKAVEARKPLRPAFLDGSRECGWCKFYQHCHGASKG